MSKRLLLIGWDAADWKILHPLIDVGAMPCLGKVVEEGVSGELLCTQPLVGAIQWTSIATAKRAWQHRICHSFESRPDGRGASLIGAEKVCAKPMWDILGMAGKRCLVVGWPATHDGQAPNCFIVSDRYAEPTAQPGVKPWPPAIEGTYFPSNIASTLNPLRMSPEDIQADVISQYVHKWNNIDQKRDRRLGQLRLFLATDFSFQTAMAKMMTMAPWDFAAIRFPALGAISQLFLPFNPPREHGINEEEFALYSEVIPQACVMLDRMLRDLLQAAGKDTAVIVVSPHGVRRPQGLMRTKESALAWKSSYGVFAAVGDGFARDALVYGAGVLDVAPTVLSWFGVPIGDDMEGRVLIESFASAPVITRVETWERKPAHPAAARPEGATNARVDTLQATLDREYNWNLAQSCLEAGKREQALPVLDRLLRNFPERIDFCHALFQCQLSLQRLADAEDTLSLLIEGVPAGILAILPRAELAIAKRLINEARGLVHEALKCKNVTHPDSMRRLGLLLLRLREWKPLEDLAKRAIELDENEPIAWLGLAEAQLRGRQAADAERSALKAIGLKYFFPQAHFVLARSLVAQGKWEEARHAMAAIMRMQPNNKAASAYSKRLRNPSSTNGEAGSPRNAS
jgi:predicted AlkP superfamily phosphohydrolase/phosphomutase